LPRASAAAIASAKKMSALRHLRTVSSLGTPGEPHTALSSSPASTRATISAFSRGASWR